MLSLFGNSLGNLQSLKEVTFYHGKDSVIKVLREKLSELGFKPIMSIEPEKNMKKINNSSLEIARQDHSKIVKMMN